MKTKNVYLMSQVEYLRKNYADLPVSHFAELWGITTRKVYDLAERYDIKRRAPNGAPVWRQAA